MSPMKPFQARYSILNDLNFALNSTLDYVSHQCTDMLGLLNRTVFRVNVNEMFNFDLN